MGHNNEEHGIARLVMNANMRGVGVNYLVRTIALRSKCRIDYNSSL